MFIQDLLELHHIGWCALRFEVGVVQRNVQVAQLQQGHAGPRSAGQIGCSFGQLAVVGLGAGAAGEDKEFAHGPIVVNKQGSR